MSKLILDFYSQTNENNSLKEKEIFELVKNSNEESIQKKLESSSDWEYLYHLAHQRGNIITPLFIKKNDQCLEVGSECGAVSNIILKYSDYLDCIELSKLQSEINYERNKTKDHLNIYVGNFQEISPKLNKKYDKIFLIGSFAYASKYFPNSANPYLEMLTEIKKLLKKDGELYIAIENKYGMKYFNGAKEDHTGKTFESIEGYIKDEAKTFSSIQLREMLKEAGYKDVYFYYPLPDYKFANVIYSEDYLPRLDGVTNVGHSLDRERAVLFNEDKALGEAADSGVFEIFANSFLIKAGF